ncbi:UNKNOWN [Stylonychia lemnae]|uniref:TLDc domain-containing protein n=1 Tax=Stylonychia lemnae TaxID=5949 RepID=A0A078AXW4_STYLE|nr:UNKNOWN [Stylonychia lemnae]|eukprot:CDW86077.1 UNKNOWN [Stylonychia lemnae]
MSAIAIVAIRGIKKWPNKKIQIIQNILSKIIKYRDIDKFVAADDYMKFIDKIRGIIDLDCNEEGLMISNGKFDLFEHFYEENLLQANLDYNSDNEGSENLSNEDISDENDDADDYDDELRLNDDDDESSQLIQATDDEDLFGNSSPLKRNQNLKGEDIYNITNKRKIKQQDKQDQKIIKQEIASGQQNINQSEELKVEISDQNIFIKLPQVNQIPDHLKNDKKHLNFRKLVNNELGPSNYSIIKGKLFQTYEFVKFNLIYKGLRDGFQSQKFHELCNDKGPTICFIMNWTGNVFGGFTSIDWKSEGGYKPDKEAFLFSLTDQELLFQRDNEVNAVNHGSNFSWSQGSGKDLHICDNCNNQSQSISQSFSYFNKIQGQYSTYLTGNTHFKVLDIEVYAVDLTRRLISNQ